MRVELIRPIQLLVRTQILKHFTQKANYCMTVKGLFTKPWQMNTPSSKKGLTCTNITVKVLIVNAKSLFASVGYWRKLMIPNILLIHSIKGSWTWTYVSWLCWKHPVSIIFKKKNIPANANQPYMNLIDKRLCCGQLSSNVSSSYAQSPGWSAFWSFCKGASQVCDPERDAGAMEQ